MIFDTGEFEGSSVGYTGTKDALPRSSVPNSERPKMHQANAKTPDSPALDTGAAAIYLGMRPTTLRSWRRRGRGPVFLKFDSGTVRYRLTDLEQFACGYAPHPLSGEARS